MARWVVILLARWYFISEVSPCKKSTTKHSVLTANTRWLIMQEACQIRSFSLFSVSSREPPRFSLFTLMGVHVLARSARGNKTVHEIELGLDARRALRCSEIPVSVRRALVDNRTIPSSRYRRRSGMQSFRLLRHSEMSKIAARRFQQLQSIVPIVARCCCSRISFLQFTPNANQSIEKSFFLAIQCLVSIKSPFHAIK